MHCNAVRDFGSAINALWPLCLDSPFRRQEQGDWPDVFVQCSFHLPSKVTQIPSYADCRLRSYASGTIPVNVSRAAAEFTGREAERMKSARLRTLKAISLALILPGLAGLIVSAMFSVHYLDTMPRWPSPDELRTVPRNIHGIVVYQTAAEDRKLNLMEFSSVGVFVAGLGLGLLYLEKWGARQTRAAEQDDRLTENYG